MSAKGGKLPEDKKEREKKLKAEFKEALEGTAEAVGHEPATLKSQYLVPGLEDEFLKDGTVTEKMDKKAIIALPNATDGNDPDDWGVAPDDYVTDAEQAARVAAFSQCRWDRAHPGVRCPVDSDNLDDIQVESLGTVDGYTIWAVDGQVVRDRVDIDFTQGGNPAVYGYVPEGEVWVEDKESAKDMAATVLHELVETFLMTHRGLDTEPDVLPGRERPASTSGPRGRLSDGS